MADHTAPEVLARLATLETRLARYERRDQREHTTRRALPLLLAALLVALVPLATLAANPFTDLNPGSVHNPNIDAIYTAGITTGCDPNVSYCPSGLVTREEMASFLARTAGLGGNPPVANARTAQSAVTAPTAASATNAQQLGGLPAGAYLRASGAVTHWSMPWSLVALGAAGVAIAPQDNAVAVSRPGAGAGVYTVALPLDRPATLADAPLRVVAAQVCVAQGSIGAAALRAATPQGAVIDRAADPTFRPATPGIACFELRPPTPQSVEGALYLQLQFATPGTTFLYPVRLTLALP